VLIKLWKEQRPKLTFERLQQIDSALDRRLEELKTLKVPPPEDHRSFRRKAESYLRDKMLEYLLS
jgi:hypothetical protein